MTLVTQSIPALIGGVSQQAPSQRLVTQVERQENCLNSITQGMRKRPNTELLSYLATQGLDLTQAHVHQIDRDAYEKYVVFVLPNGVHVFDRMTGYKYPVLTPANADGVSPLSYLALDNHTGTYRDAYQTLTSADTTWILNTSKAVYRKVGSIKDEDTVTRYEIAISGLGAYTRQNETGRYVLSLDGQTIVNMAHTTSPISVAYKVSKWFSDNRPELNPKYLANKVYLEFPKGSPMVNIIDSSYVEFREYEGRDVFTVTRNVDVYSYKETTAVYDDSKPIPEALIHIRQADYNVTYRVTVNGRSVSHTTPEATSDRARAGLSINSILNSIASKINSLNESVGAVAENGYIYLTSATDFTVSASDDLNNKAIAAVHKQTQLFSDLPTRAPRDFLVKIIGSVEDEGQGYWVEFKTTGDQGQGHWEESRIKTEVHRIDGNTMPHVLNRLQSADYMTDDNPNGVYFKFTEASWDERKIGDDLVAPFPTFVSEWDNETNLPTTQRYIHTLAFHKNRLVFTSDENVILSESGNFWNFFKTTAQIVKDSDRIDIAVLSRQVNPIKAVLPAQKELVLYGERQQYALRSGDIFSASTAYAEPLMSYDVDLRAAPQAVGKSVFFAVNREKFNGIFESFVEDDQHSAIEVTAHCPEYIEGRVRKIITTGSEDILLVLPERSDRGNLDKVYCYSFKNQGNERVQSAWNVWTFNGKILDVVIYKSEATFVVEYDGVVTTEKMNLAEDAVRDTIGVPVFLDRRVEVDAAKKPVGDERKIAYKGRYFIGLPYTQEAELTELSMKDNNQRSVQSGRLQLRHITFTFDETTAFDVIVESEAREQRIVEFEGRRIGSLSAMIGTIPVDSGELRVPLLGRAKGMKVTIRNSEPFDCRIQSADWEAIYYSRARRV